MIGIGHWNCESGLGIGIGIGIGNWDWGLGLGIRIRDWGLGLGIRIWDLDLGFIFGVRYLNQELGLSMSNGITIDEELELKLQLN